ncbi:hypothetical protein [Nostoc sp.]|uniref:hypothetical protein n=2 Tax=Nostoc sp. TaxID=1180 RepID=UPI002FF2583E
MNMVKESQNRLKHFTSLKSKYQATKYNDSSPASLLYLILRKVDLGIELLDLEFNWLQEHELFETLEIIWLQQFRMGESKRLEAEFSHLKAKYKVAKNWESSVGSVLYPILWKLESENSLTDSEVQFLQDNHLTQIVAIVQDIKRFANLKQKYQATKYQNSYPDSPLYKILKKLDLEASLSDAEYEWLLDNELFETIEFFEKQEFINEIANDKYVNTLKLNIESGKTLNETEIEWLKNHEREDIIILAQQKHFAGLKSKYGVLDYQDKSHTSLLYIILQKLELKERLEPTDVAWLQDNNTEVPQATYSYYMCQEYKLFSGKILIAYHTIEANFYEQEFQRTDNKWNLVNASSHWRKANEPEQALQLTNNLHFDRIQVNKLKSALLTSRGGAFRDIEKLDKAENCAHQAIEYQPESHHPYTLMGAICFERHQYSDGEYWFQEAIQRGANPRDMDSEIKRVVKNAKDKNKHREVIEYLLKKDSQRYSWAKSYLKKSQNNGK